MFCYTFNKQSPEGEEGVGVGERLGDDGKCTINHSRDNKGYTIDGSTDILFQSLIAMNH